MKKIIFCTEVMAFLCLLMVSSCNDRNNLQDVYGGHNLLGNLHIYIEYVDSKGANILQNSSPVAVFYEKDGMAQLVERLNLDVPFGYVIKSKRVISQNNPDELCVDFFPSDYLDKENFSTTFVKLGNNSMDTFRCQFFNESGVFYLLKVWHNGTPVWEHKVNLTQPLITIVKL